MAVKKTSTIRERILNTLLAEGPMDIVQLCFEINSAPDLIIGALQSILSHKEILMAREKVHNRVVTWVAHPQTRREKLYKYAPREEWSNKKSLLNLKKLRMQILEFPPGFRDEYRKDGTSFLTQYREKDEHTAKKPEVKDTPSLVVYTMQPGQNEPEVYNELEIEESGSALVNTNPDQPFKLDKFQQIAIEAVLSEKLVLVSAPTGTGKTLIAEKLAEKLLKENQRMIYTSPLKALSNQKFRDFIKMFGADNVGLVTGDVSINGNALLLVMTTEIFRNKCFGEPEELGGVGYVVFDEIHYLDDQARGTAWEESIIFAPGHVKILGLSATVPNISELAGWISDVRRSPVIVVEERQRIVPLEISWLTVKGEAVDEEEAKRVIEDYLTNYNEDDSYDQEFLQPWEKHGRRRRQPR